MSFRGFVLLAVLAGGLIGVGYSRAQIWQPWTHGTGAVGGGGTTCTNSAGLTAAGNFFTRAPMTAGPQKNALQDAICYSVQDNLITGNLTGATGGCGALFDVIYVFATDTLAHSLLNLCGTSYTAIQNGLTGSGGPPPANGWQQWNGWTGLATTTDYLDSQYTPTTGPAYTQNSAHFSVWNLTATGDTSNADIAGAANGSVTQMALMNPNFSGTNTNCDINGNIGGGNRLTVSPAQFKGWMLCNRPDANTAQYYLNGVLQGTNTPPSVAMTGIGSFFFLAARVDAVAYSGAPYQLAMGTLGAGLSPGQATAFQSRWCAYLTAVRGGC